MDTPAVGFDFVCDFAVFGFFLCASVVKIYVGTAALGCPAGQSPAAPSITANYWALP
jgi:hypothetical protein